MDEGSLLVRPGLGARRGHQLVDADGQVLADLEVATSRDRGSIVVDDRRWTVRRPPSGRAWTITAGAADDPADEAVARDGAGASGDVVATITKPSAVRERFELEVAGERVGIEPRGPVGRRRWVVGAAGSPMIEVTQGLVRRRWHELRPAGPSSPPGQRLTIAGRDLAPALTIVVAFVVALVDTTPPTGLSGLRRADS